MTSKTKRKGVLVQALASGKNRNKKKPEDPSYSVGTFGARGAKFQEREERQVGPIQQVKGSTHHKKDTVFVRPKKRSMERDCLTLGVQQWGWEC